MPTSMGVRGPCTKHRGCGCQAALCCFDCPLPDCVLEAQGRPLTMIRQQKAQEMRDQGMAPEAIAQELGVTVRTVWRALSAS